jgi:5,10-methylenetetrahydromethanopterin reductase
MERIGITLREQVPRLLLECAQKADRVGIESLWLPESPGEWDVTVLAAALSRATRASLIATGVLNIYIRNPVQALMMTASLDELTGGRFILGVGSGNAGQLRKIGIDQGARSLRYTREFIEMISIGLAKDRATYEGEMLRIPEIQQILKRENSKVPIYLGAHNPQMLRLGGQVADGVLLNTVSIDDVPKSVSFVRDGERKSGRTYSTDIAAYIPTCISSNENEAIAAAKVVLASFCSSPIFRKRLENFGSSFLDLAKQVHTTSNSKGLDAAVNLVPDAIVHRYAIAGRNETLAKRLQEFRIAGVTLPILSVFPVPLQLKQHFPPVPVSGFHNDTMNVLSLFG